MGVGGSGVSVGGCSGSGVSVGGGSGVLVGGGGGTVGVGGMVITAATVGVKVGRGVRVGGSSTSSESSTEAGETEQARLIATNSIIIANKRRVISNLHLSRGMGGNPPLHSTRLCRAAFSPKFQAAYLSIAQLFSLA